MTGHERIRSQVYQVNSNVISRIMKITAFSVYQSLEIFPLMTEKGKKKQVMAVTFLLSAQFLRHVHQSALTCDFPLRQMLF